MRRFMWGSFCAVALAMVSSLALWSSGTNAANPTSKVSSNMSAGMKQTSISLV